MDRSYGRMVEMALGQNRLWLLFIDMGKCITTTTRYAIFMSRRLVKDRCHTLLCHYCKDRNLEARGYRKLDLKKYP